MKKKLTVKEYIYVASMLFGLFFGAGNLIFPTAVGQLAGRNMWSAILGLLITGVGLRCWVLQLWGFPAVMVCLRSAAR